MKCKVGRRRAWITQIVALRVCGFAVIVAACTFASHASWAQNQAPARPTSSDLARQNLGYVAASAGELKAVLLKDVGLMVELKRWVAKDATEHGQIISDSDLTNDAIFQRLEEDSQFRSIATILVQRYGYLLPKVDPDSELGKERELLIQDRTKWIAQDQEEQLTAARERNARNSQYPRSCDSQTDPDCKAPQQSNLNSSAPGSQGQQPSQPGTEGQPQRTAPIQENLPGIAGNGDSLSNLGQLGDQPADTFSSLQPRDALQSQQSSRDLDSSSPGRPMAGIPNTPSGSGAQSNSEPNDEFGQGSIQRNGAEPLSLIHI